MIKMSEFLQCRKIVFKNNKIEYVEPSINGEVEAFEVTNEKAKEMIKVIGKDDVRDNEFLYKMFPLLISVEMDIDYEEFIGLVGTPRNGFEHILSLVISLIDEYFDRIKSMKKTYEDMLEVQEKHKDFIDLGKAEELNKLEEELNEE